eukprot:454620-Amphidinium_carterae.1
MEMRFTGDTTLSRVPLQEVESPTEIPMPTERSAARLHQRLADASPTEVPLPTVSQGLEEAATELPMPSERASRFAWREAREEVAPEPASPASMP